MSRKQSLTITGKETIQSSHLQKRINDISSCRTDIENRFAECFTDLKKKIIKNIEKSEKRILKEFADICTASVSLLANQNEQLSLNSCTRKADAFYSSMRAIDMEESVKMIEKVTKSLSEGLKDFKEVLLRNFGAISEQEKMDLKPMVQFDETVDRICLVNERIINISSKNSLIRCQSNKSTLSRKIDAVAVVRLPQKNKEYLLVLAENVMQFFNDKLVMIGRKEIDYQSYGKIVQTTSIKGTAYVNIIFANRVIRLNLGNLADVFSKIVAEPILLASETDLNGSLVYYSEGNKLVMLSQELQKYYEIISPIDPKHIKCDDSFIYLLGHNKVAVLSNLQLVVNCNNIEHPLDMVSTMDGGMRLLITGNNFCYELVNSDKQDAEQRNHNEVLNLVENSKFGLRRAFKEQRNKIKQVASSSKGNFLYCLSENGKKLSKCEIL